MSKLEPTKIDIDLSKKETSIEVYIRELKEYYETIGDKDKTAI